MTETRSADPRYLQVARELRQEIIDGSYPVGSQLPTEHELCERFSVSRYTVREALRRLREDHLIESRPRAGTLVVPRTKTGSYAQDVMSIDDLMAFATGAQFVIHANKMLTVDAALHERTGLDEVDEDLADEEGVALGLGRDHPGEHLDLGGVDVAATGLGEEQRDLVAVEAGQVDPRHRRLAPEVGERGGERVGAVEVGVAVGADHEHPGVAQVADQVAQEQQAGLVGPVEVVEHDQHGGVVAGPGEQVGDRPEEAEPLGVGVGPRRFGSVEAG